MLFKAKRLDTKEWVYGYYVKLILSTGKEKHYILTGNSRPIYCNSKIVETFEKHKINPKTLCRNTFVKDKNSNEIWENDIIKFPSKSNCFIDIEFSNYKKGKPPEYIISKIEFVNGIFWFTGQYGYEGLEVRFSDVEVIGNIFDNPDIKLTEW